MGSVESHGLGKHRHEVVQEPNVESLTKNTCSFRLSGFWVSLGRGILWMQMLVRKCKRLRGFLPLEHWGPRP